MDKGSGPSSSASTDAAREAWGLPEPVGGTALSRPSLDAHQIVAEVAKALNTAVERAATIATSEVAPPLRQAATKAREQAAALAAHDVSPAMRETKSRFVSKSMVLFTAATTVAVQRLEAAPDRLIDAVAKRMKVPPELLVPQQATSTVPDLSTAEASIPGTGQADTRPVSDVDEGARVAP